MKPEFWKLKWLLWQKIKKKDLNPDERGFVLVIALIVLLVATVVGIFAIQNTAIDTRIAGNERIATVMFNAADSGAAAGVTWFSSNHDHITTPPFKSFLQNDLPLSGGGAYNFNIEPEYIYGNTEIVTSPPPPGWEAGAPGNANQAKYWTYHYIISGRGSAQGAAGNRVVEVGASLIYQEGKEPH